MSSLLVRGRSSTLRNHSASETDLSSKFRRRSVQSINNFSSRRVLGTEPVIHSFRPTSKDAANPTRPDEPPSLPKTGGWRRTNRGDVLIPQPFSSCRRSHLDPQHLPAPAIIILHPTGASGMNTSPPLHHHHRDLASTDPVGKPIDSLSPRSPLASILKPLFARPLQLPQTMGNRLTNGLHHGRCKENKPPEVKSESAKSIVRPASSPAPARSNHLPLPFPIVIPDRRSSITPQPHNTPGNVSPARTVRPGDVVHPPPRSATAPGTKPSGEDYLSPLPKYNIELSTPTTLEIKTSNPPSTSSSNPLTPRSPGSFPYLTLDLPIRAPPLTLAHFACYQSHRRVSFSPNIHNPVPCMTCEVEGGKARWKCQWCCLRICPGCMERLSKIEGRDLNRLMQRLKEEGRTFLGGSKEEWGDGNGLMWDDDGHGGGTGEEGGSLRVRMGMGIDMEKKEEEARGEDEETSLATSVVAGSVVEGQRKENHNHGEQRGGTRGLELKRGPGIDRGKARVRERERERGHGRGGGEYGHERGHGHGYSHGHGHRHGHRHAHAHEHEYEYEYEHGRRNGHGRGHWHWA